MSHLTRGRQARIEPASSTFLFDRARTGRSRFRVGELRRPEVVWRCRLPNHPPRGPESTPAFDHGGNLYFGCHDGCVYSLGADGHLRWVFRAGDKVYSSPTVVANTYVLVASGEGRLLCLTLDGSLHWAYDIDGRELLDGPYQRQRHRLFSALQRPRYQGSRTTRCWSSPIVSPDDRVVYVTSRGLGLHAVDLQSGERPWARSLGLPGNHLAGAAIEDAGGVLAAGQRGPLACFDPDGRIRFAQPLPRGYDAWGNPSYDVQHEAVYQTLARGERRGLVVALDATTGRERWRRTLPTGIRGSAAVESGDQEVASPRRLWVGGLDGALYGLRADTGTILERRSLTTARRGLWTTPCIDADGRIVVSVKTSFTTGTIVCFEADGRVRWCHDTGKALATPVLDHAHKLYVGTWCGDMLCLQT